MKAELWRYAGGLLELRVPGTGADLQKSGEDWRLVGTVDLNLTVDELAAAGGTDDADEGR